jgi:hypothetical protein
MVLESLIIKKPLESKVTASSEKEKCKCLLINKHLKKTIINYFANASPKTTPLLNT